MSTDPSGLDVWGFNFGYGGTAKVKGAVNYMFLFDSKGNFAVQRSFEAGRGIGKPTFSIFGNLVYGLSDTVFDLEGPGAAISGSFGPFNGSAATGLNADKSLNECTGGTNWELYGGASHL